MIITTNLHYGITGLTGLGCMLMGVYAKCTKDTGITN